MNNSNLQLTVRGIDSQTKQQLSKLAARKGISLNRLMVTALKQAAGTGGTQARLQLMRQTVRKYRISSKDIAAAETAITEMDDISKAKQRRDEA